MELLMLTPTTDPTSGWGQYSDAVIRRLSSRFDLEVRDDLPGPMDIITRPDRLVGAVRSVRRSVSGVDAVFSMVAFPYSLIAYLATRGTDTPFFVTCHGTYAVAPLHYPLIAGAARRSFTNATRLFAASSFTAERMRRRVAGLDNLTVVPNGVEIPDGEPVTPFDINHQVSLSVGKFKPRKGQHVVVEVLARVADRFPDLDHHFVGSGSDSRYANRVIARARELGIEDRVHVEGTVSDEALDRWYASADVFLLPSQYVAHHFEGFGIVYLEANRFGVPVIGPNDCGAVDAIEHGTSGVCVDNDVDSFASALATVLGDEGRYEELAQGAKEWARAHTWDRTVERLADEVQASVGVATS